MFALYNLGLERACPHGSSHFLSCRAGAALQGGMWGGGDVEK